MNNEHPINNLMQSTMENLKDMIDVNTIIGDTVLTQDGGCIIPISKVSFGFAAGGSEFCSVNKKEAESQSKYPFGGGSGAGVSINPIAFLVLHKDSVRLLPVEATTPYDRVADNIPQILDMIKNFFSNKTNKKVPPGNDPKETESTCTSDEVE